MGSGSSLLATAQSLGNTTSNRQLYDIIPRLIRNDKSGLPTMGDIMSATLDLTIVILSLFIVFRIFIPESMILNGTNFWLLIATFLLIPSVTSFVCLSIRGTYPEGKGEDGVVFPSIALIVSILPVIFLMYLAWFVTNITGLEVGALYVILWLCVFIPVVMGVSAVSKAVAPVLILILGPGVIPHLANQSFFDFCT